MDNTSLTGGVSVPSGELRLLRQRHLGDLSKRKGPGLAWRLRNWFEHGHRSTSTRVRTQMSGSIFGVTAPIGTLSLRKYTPDLTKLDLIQFQQLRHLLLMNENVHDLAGHFGGYVTDFGGVSCRVITTAGVAFLAGCFPNTNEPELFKFHGFGVGTNAEASGDTALQTEETTQYNPDNTRPTGSQSASTNTYTTVGTYSPDSGATRAITEHGIFSQAATGGGTLLDRSVFSVVNLTAGSDSLQATYVLTLPAGS